MEIIISKAKISPLAVMKLYKAPKNESTLSVLKTPSMTISILPISITQKPQKTRACRNPITGRLKILLWKKATSKRTLKRLPKSFTGNGLVKVKNLDILFMV
jgi:hypothetical protein